MDYINTRQAAATLGVSASWLNKLRVTGNGPAYCKVGRRVLYRRGDLARWIEDHTQHSTSQNSQ